MRNLNLMTGLIAGMTMISLFTGCSSMNKKNAPEYRIAIDAESISYDDYNNLVSELHKTGNFYIVDRAQAFNAVKKEQERLHVTESHRFQAKEKWALWKRLWGVGAIVVAHTSCAKKMAWFARGYYNRCRQTLTAVDASTGHVLVSVNKKSDTPVDEFEVAAPWEDTVAEFVDKFPTSVDKYEWKGRAKDRAEYAEAFDNEKMDIEFKKRELNMQRDDVQRLYDRLNQEAEVTKAKSRAPAEEVAQVKSVEPKEATEEAVLEE